GREGGREGVQAGELLEARPPAPEGDPADRLAGGGGGLRGAELRDARVHHRPDLGQARPAVGPGAVAAGPVEVDERVGDPAIGVERGRERRGGGPGPAGGGPRRGGGADAPPRGGGPPPRAPARAPPPGAR